MRVSKNWVKFNKMFTLSPCRQGREAHPRHNNSLQGLIHEQIYARRPDRRVDGNAGREHTLLIF